MIKKLIKKKSIELKKVTLKFSKFNNNKFCFRMKLLSFLLHYTYNLMMNYVI